MNYSRVFGMFANRSVISVIATVILSVMLIAAIVEAATTISTNISTGGTLNVTGLTTLGFASSTTQSLTGNLIVNGYATTTGASGNFATQGTLTVVGTADVTGNTTLASTTATGFKVGQVGTRHTVIISGTCNILADSSINATTTGYADCAATGVVAADKVFFTLATTSPSGVGSPGGFHVMGANASSSSGYITFSIANYTGANRIPAATANFGSSTQYWVVR